MDSFIEDPLIRRSFWVVFIVLIGILIWERFPSTWKEGFANVDQPSDFWRRLVPRRGDVGPEREDGGQVRDPRQFADQADVQRFGTKTDFCRMVQRPGAPETLMFACALGGTENLSSVAQRSKTVKEGLRLGRDDQMRDVNGDGQEDQCRIVKMGNNDFQALCLVGDETKFLTEEQPDPNPPEETKMLLSFQQDSAFWLRFRDDMMDQSENLQLNAAGGAAVDEKEPRPKETKGITFNGINQQLRIGDDPQLAFGSVVQLRMVRGFHLWVRFDEFTNNAHIFDFGNGAGNDNIWVGILNRGNQSLDVQVPKNLCGTTNDVLPKGKSGAQPVEEITPQQLMKESAANCDEQDCPGFAVQAVQPCREDKKKTPKQMGTFEAMSADLVQEVWDRDQRKQRIIVPNFFKKGYWTHLVIMAEDNNAFRPALAIYKDGQKVFTQPNAWLPQANATTHNQLGRSNWMSLTSQQANNDDLFKGAIFDFRAQQGIKDAKWVRQSQLWGGRLLGLPECLEEKN